jgi:hypothetical protein
LKILIFDIVLDFYISISNFIYLHVSSASRFSPCTPCGSGLQLLYEFPGVSLAKSPYFSGIFKFFLPLRLWSTQVNKNLCEVQSLFVWQPHPEGMGMEKHCAMTFFLTKRNLLNKNLIVSVEYKPATMRKHQ